MKRINGVPVCSAILTKISNAADEAVKLLTEGDDGRGFNCNPVGVFVLKPKVFLLGHENNTAEITLRTFRGFPVSWWGCPMCAHELVTHDYVVRQVVEWFHDHKFDLSHVPKQEKPAKPATKQFAALGERSLDL